MNEYQIEELTTDLKAIVGENSPHITAIMEAIKKNSHYCVEAIRYYHDTDRDNYPRTTHEDSTTIRGRTLDELYEKMAIHKSSEETPRDNRHGYYGIEFERIEHILGSIDDNDAIEVDDARLEGTAAWKVHQERLAAQEKEKERKRIADEETKAAKQRAAELAMLETLKAKYPSNG